LIDEAGLMMLLGVVRGMLSLSGSICKVVSHVVDSMKRHIPVTHGNVARRRFLYPRRGIISPEMKTRALDVLDWGGVLGSTSR